MRSTIAANYEFIAGHFLPKVPEGHRCRRQHGHNYILRVIVNGYTREDGMVMDFYELNAIVEPLIEMLDHRNLNDIEGLDNPTAEIIAAWFWKRIVAGVNYNANMMIKCRVYETPSCYAEYGGAV